MERARMDAFFAGLETRGWEMGLDRIRSALETAGRPQDSMSIVTVAGTNGKGSVACILHKLAVAHGIRTGLYTSPNLIRFNERIVFNGDQITDADACEIAGELEPLACRHSLTMFEFATIMALRHFRNKGAELAVMEVGLGGRLDAVNACDPCAAAITPIGLDHTEYLGPDVASIAAEKCGVIRKGIPVVSSAQDPAAACVITGKCASAGARLVALGADYSFRRFPAQSVDSPERFDYCGAAMELKDVHLSLKGGIQPANAAQALTLFGEIAGVFGIKPLKAKVRKAMAEVFWPARFQVTGGDPAVVIDGTHNPHGAAALAETIRERCGDRGVVFVFGALGEKDFGGVIAKLAPLAAGAVVTRPDSSRAADPEKVAAEWKREGIQAVVNGEPAAALHVARGLAGPLGVPVVVCGSLYLVGSYLEPGWKL